LWLADGCAGIDGGTEAAEAGAVGGFACALATLRTLAAPLAGLAWPNVAAYTPAAAMANRATSAIAAVIRPVRKLISSSWALTAARRPEEGACTPWYPPTFTAWDDTDKGGH
jgi:hypothetical protein